MVRGYASKGGERGGTQPKVEGEAAPLGTMVGEISAAAGLVRPVTGATKLQRTDPCDQSAEHTKKRPRPFPSFLAPKRPEDFYNLIYPDREPPQTSDSEFPGKGKIGAE